MMSLGLQSNANSSNLNTDVLTYSLTNTFSTIESLHDELTAIRNGLEVSQKRSGNILRTIHRYAREIEENKMSDEEDENVKSNDEINLSNFEEDNLTFMKDIKHFYNKIHDEISQLKGILIDTKRHSPLQQSRKHMLSEKVP